MKPMRKFPAHSDYEADYSVLTELGCSPLAQACYRSLYEDGFATAGQLAERLGKRSRNGLYEVLNRLEDVKLVTCNRFEGWMIYFYVPIIQALVKHHRDQRAELSELIEFQQLRAGNFDEYA